MAEQKARFSGTALVLLAALFWSTNGVAIKYVALGPVAIAALRALVAGLVLLPFIRLRELKFSWPLIGLIASYAFMSGTFVTATKLTAAGNAIALQYTAPLWIFGVGLVLGRTELSIRRALPMLLVAAGIAAFMAEPVSGSTLLGNLLGIASGLGFALVTACFRALRDRHNLTVLSVTNLASACLLLPFVTGFGDAAELSTAGWLCILWLGIFQMGAGYVFYSLGLKRVTTLKAATIALLEPVLNPLWVALFISEVPTAYGIGGAAMILSGVLLDVRLNPEHPDVNDPPVAS